MGQNSLRIRHGDVGWHGCFFEFMAQAFAPGGTFKTCVGRQRMHFVIDGAEREGFQLGAVATRSDHRGRGLSRLVLSQALSDGDATKQPTILFANRSVLDFYPRFGFRRIMQKRFVATERIEAAANPAPTIDLAMAPDRTRLAQLCARAGAVGRTFSARNYYSTVLWHLTHKPKSVFWFDGLDAALIASVDHERLVLHDLIATRPFDLTLALPHLIHRPVSEVEFRFGPDDWWPTARVLEAEETDSPLFVRGLEFLSTAAFRFPDLAQT
ncbi:MAG: GNAT family N-acetyltransferase [Proteobacteria bacterium]|nr:GNAT family N-acetyltransferase [Pseudomonadota bacterium]